MDNAALKETGMVDQEIVADDGFTGEVPLPDLQACTDCIVSFRNQGGFSIVMPGFTINLQVKGVVEIQVKLSFVETGTAQVSRAGESE